MAADRPYQLKRATSSLLLDIDPRRKAPLFDQIYEQIRIRVLAGQLASGAALPSSRRLAAELGVSRSTVVRAYDALGAEGYVLVDPRSAVRVALPDKPAIGIPARGTTRLLVPRLSRLARDELAIPSGVPRLGVAPRAFRPGVPALELFPIATWTRFVARSHARAGVSLLEAVDPQGHRGLREAIAHGVAAARGVRATTDQVFITTGMNQTFEEVLRLTVDPGEQVWIEDPGYLGTRRAVIVVGATPVPIPVDAEGIDVSAGLARAPEARAAIVTPSHHYPLGVTTSIARRIALLAWAKRARAVVIEDDYDSEFRHHGRPVMSLAGLDDAGCVVYAGTFTKTMYPGLRIGFAIVPVGLVDRYVAIRHRTGNPASIVEQDALATFISDGQFARHVRRMRLEYRERAEAFADALYAECAPALELGPCDTGMQAYAALASGSDSELRDTALLRGLEIGALSEYFVGHPRLAGAVFGFGCIRPAALRAGCRELGAILRSRPRCR